jgi:hypothetical protein
MHLDRALSIKPLSNIFLISGQFVPRSSSIVRSISKVSNFAVNLTEDTAKARFAIRRENAVKQLSLFPEADIMARPAKTANCAERDRIEAKFTPYMSEELRLGQLVSYAGNKSLPVLGLFRYKEAFSFALVMGDRAS